MRSMLVFMDGGATYLNGFAGMHGMHVVGGVAMVCEAMHTEL